MQGVISETVKTVLFANEDRKGVQPVTAEVVIRTYSDMVYRIAYARTGNREDADDIYQEVFLRYIRRNPEFRSEEHAKAWFIKVSINCARKFMGKRQKNAETSGDLTDVLLPQENDSGALAGVTVEEQLLDKEKASQLHRELQKLDSDTRLLLHLYYFEELKTKEIARLLHKSESAVRVALSRARVKLKIQAQEDGVLELLRS